MILGPKMTQKTTLFLVVGRSFSHLFRDLVRRSTFGRIFVALWLPFGTLLDACGSLWAFWLPLAPFWTPLAPFGLPLCSLWLPLGSLLAPISSL